MESLKNNLLVSFTLALSVLSLTAEAKPAIPLYEGQCLAAVESALGILSAGAFAPDFRVSLENTTAVRGPFFKVDYILFYAGKSVDAKATLKLEVTEQKFSLERANNARHYRMISACKVVSGKLNR